MPGRCFPRPQLPTTEARGREPGFSIGPAFSVRQVTRLKLSSMRAQWCARRARQGKRPVDGYYVTLWRLMLRHPELLAWEMLWTDILRETYAAIYGKVKSIKPSVGVGWHIWHNNSFSPIYRAEQDLSELSKYSDFLKMVMYHNCGGPRMASYIGSVGATTFGDVPQQELLDFHYRILDYKQENQDATVAGDRHRDSDRSIAE